MLATIVATPCTAPFMGSALGFALTQPDWVSLVIFTGLGVGMSLPYLLLSLFPPLLALIPKPGAWMKSLKQFMGFLLIATIVWLGWVLQVQTGTNGVLKLVSGLAIAFFGALVLGKWGAPFQTFVVRMIGRLVAFAVIAVGILVSLSYLKPQSRSVSERGINASGIRWEVFSPERVEKLHQQDTPVFIDFTAAWCLTCQVNERVAFSSREVQDGFKQLGIVAMKADWTSRDKIVTKALQGFGRNGVPLYVMYGKNPNDPPAILPEIITPKIVLKELEKLK